MPPWLQPHALPKLNQRRLMQFVAQRTSVLLKTTRSLAVNCVFNVSSVTKSAVTANLDSHPGRTQSPFSMLKSISQSGKPRSIPARHTLVAFSPPWSSRLVQLVHQRPVADVERIGGLPAVPVVGL